MFEAKLDIIALCVALLGGFAWLVRNESNTKSNSSRIEKLEASHVGMRDELYNKVSDMEKLLYEIKGKLSNNNNQGA